MIWFIYVIFWYNKENYIDKLIDELDFEKIMIKNLEILILYVKIIGVFLYYIFYYFIMIVVLSIFRVIFKVNLKIFGYVINWWFNRYIKSKYRVLCWIGW